MSKQTYLQALVKDDLLALEPDVLGPLDEAGEVLLRGQVAADAERARLLLEERVLGRSGLLATLGV